MLSPNFEAVRTLTTAKHISSKQRSLCIGITTCGVLAATMKTIQRYADQPTPKIINKRFAAGHRERKSIIETATKQITETATPQRKSISKRKYMVCIAI